MVLARAREAFDHPDFIFEPKLDGFRALAYLEGGVCRLVSRKKHTYKSFQPLCAAIAQALHVTDAILDGEIVCVGADGRPLFNTLLYRRGEPYFYAFDVLWLDGCDLRKLTCLERKHRLRAIIPQQPFPVLYTDHEDRHGTGLYGAVCAMDLEGIVAKWKHGAYLEDENSTSWVKIKNPAYSQAVGRHEQFTRFRRLAFYSGK